MIISSQNTIKIRKCNHTCINYVILTKIKSRNDFGLMGHKHQIHALKPPRGLGDLIGNQANFNEIK